MARLGLGERWKCVFANEWCAKKASAYRANFGRCDELRECDVAKLKTRDLPGVADLVWASFPCQDLSLAGNGAGLEGNRSGTFAPFWELMQGVVAEGRGPRIVVLENVVGALTSHGGRDFAAILQSLIDAGYRAGALVMDAVRFVPQSRPRLFIVGVQKDVRVPAKLLLKWPQRAWHSRSLMKAYASLPSHAQEHWIWWNLPESTESVQDQRTY